MTVTDATTDMSQGSMTKDKIKKILEIDVNDQTSEMIDDIIDSFDKILNNTTYNPITKITEITQEITTKYGDLIKNGDIKIDKLLSYIITKAPGLDTFLNGFMNSAPTEQVENNIIMDSNFSTSQVEVGGSVAH